jgi:cytidylate kinase
MKSLQIAIDGTAGSGKSSAARGLAARLGLPYVDSGAYYRALGLAAQRAEVDLQNTDALAHFLNDLDMDIRNNGTSQKVIVNGKDLARAIRTDEGSDAASTVAKIPAVRQSITEQLRVDGSGGCVMEGRDIGTVVLPEADFKFFLTASPEVRAIRRARDENYQRSTADLERIRKSLEDRDNRDTTRQADPLKPAEDAQEIDTSDMTLEQVISAMVEVINTV